MPKTRGFAIFLVTKTIPVKSMGDFVSFAKANPTVLNFSSAGNGTIMHLTGEAFKAETGTQMVHIPYKSNPVADSASGVLPLTFAIAAQAMPFIKSRSEEHTSELQSH